MDEEDITRKEDIIRIHSRHVIQAIDRALELKLFDIHPTAIPDTFRAPSNPRPLTNAGRRELIEAVRAYMTGPGWDDLSLIDEMD